MREVTHEPDDMWATTSVVDTEAIDHERIIASIEVCNDQVEVRIAQRIDFDLLTDPITVKASRPRATLGQMYEMNSAQAREIGEALLEAAKRLQELEAIAPDWLQRAS
ncbi:hypothetical protein Kisp01_50190 [Kineosporia sp. NBRC 101677]|uniref:hypothetical protein n=1 Tax=Kineosporia sp. NBRC 101677 TaxID=3032197 RepID=UPI0024A0B5E8|nr:hypothetical protein [Kineosporia sp. NBRC 101677]GLY18005.1 hypothetical protein Kisp01_50190 [Kineosporia sp. NBRC 101677]